MTASAGLAYGDPDTPSTHPSRHIRRAFVQRDQQMTVDPLAARGSAFADQTRTRFRGPFSRWPRRADAVLAVAAVLASVFLETEPGGMTVRALGDVPPLAFPVFAVAGAALLWRRDRPVQTLAVSVAAWCVSLVFGLGSVLAQPVALYSVGRYAANRRWSEAGLAVSAVLTAVGSALVGPLSEVPIAVLITSLIWYLGVRIRNRGERAALLRREQDAQQSRVLSEERARIARELHDVVAHRVSLMTVQAGAAKTVAAVDLPAAVAAMAAVEQAGREALGELRHLLGVLRPDTEADGLGPQPGLAAVPGLVAEFRAAGLDVSLTMSGADARLPAPVDLSAYRIVQEALTNVLKHAGPGTRAQARVAVDGEQVAVHVLDDGDGSPVLPGSDVGISGHGTSGHGIIGMRERALLLGGRLEAGRRPGGGFQVVAHLPIGEDTA
jgi:signal transduction histidine kinase